MSKYCLVDFEYGKPSEKYLGTVCCSWRCSDWEEGKVENIWLHNFDKNKRTLASQFRLYREKGYIFVSFGVVAEARSFIDMGLDPSSFKWICLYIEWRQLRNCCDKFNYGRYYIGNMRMNSVPPKLNPKANEGRNNKMLGYGLVDCCARLLNVNINRDLKRGMVDLILTNPKSYTKEERKDILEYCDSDIKYLPELHSIMNEELAKRVTYPEGTTLESSQLLRGEFAANSAIMENEGVPIDMFAIKNLRRNVDFAKNKLISDLVENHYSFFERKKARSSELIGSWRDTYKNFKEFIEGSDKIDSRNWKLTDSGRYCNDEEYLKKFDGIPEIKAYRETRKILGQLKWLRQPKEGEPDLFDAIGSDGRMRTFFGIYGTQTARNAPSAKRFIFAMSAWLRCLIRPPKGYVITELDYASQEFAIAAILSGDKNMVEAYKSGDPYLYFAKKAKAVPEDGTKQEYKTERDLFKATTLGLQYGMGIKSLAVKLSSDMGRVVTEREAEKLINLHKRVYPTYWRWLKKIDREYARKRHLLLPCGWALLGDNPHVLSVRNFPTQGGGSSGIREAVKGIMEWGIKIIAILHDAGYIISEEDQAEHDIEEAKNEMIKAFNKVLNNTTDLKIRIDVKSHIHEEVWVSEKGETYYNILKEYLGPKETKEDLDRKLMEMVYE